MIQNVPPESPAVSLKNIHMPYLVPERQLLRCQFDTEIKLTGKYSRIE